MALTATAPTAHDPVIKLTQTARELSVLGLYDEAGAKYEQVLHEIDRNILDDGGLRNVYNLTRGAWPRNTCILLKVSFGGWDGGRWSGGKGVQGINLNYFFW